MSDTAVRPNDGPIAGSQSEPAQAFQAVRRDVVEQGALLKTVDERVDLLVESISGLGDQQHAMQDILVRVAELEAIRTELKEAHEEIDSLRTARKADLARIRSLAGDRDALENEIQANAARHRQELAQYRAPRTPQAMPPARSSAPLPVPSNGAPSVTAGHAPVATGAPRIPVGQTPMPVLTRQGPLDAAHAQTLLEPAKAAMRSRNWPAAVEAYSAFLSYQPSKAGPWKQFGHALKEMGDLGSAEHAYFRALALDPSDADTPIHLAHVLKNQDQLDLAAEVFAGALQMNPGSEEARNGLSFMGYPVPDFQAPQRAATPRLSFVQRYLFKKGLARAKHAARSRDWTAAAEAYGKLIGSAPTNTRLLIQRGHAFKEMGQLDKAAALYREALAIEPLNSDAHLQLGHILKLQGDPEAARASYLRAVRFNPDNQSALDEL